MFLFCLSLIPPNYHVSCVICLSRTKKKNKKKKIPQLIEKTSNHDIPNLQFSLAVISCLLWTGGDHSGSFSSVKNLLNLWHCRNPDQGKLAVMAVNSRDPTLFHNVTQCCLSLPLWLRDPLRQELHTVSLSDTKSSYTPERGRPQRRRLIEMSSKNGWMPKRTAAEVHHPQPPPWSRSLFITRAHTHLIIRSYT